MIFGCLDIETSWEKQITVIGLYRSDTGTVQLVAPSIEPSRLREIINGVELLLTYNGAAFDLPVIEQHLGVNLTASCRHRDVLFDCRKRDLKGGLKGVEKRLGIHRDTDGLTGLDAMKLWRAHQGGHPEALEMLLRYNREDVENLAAIALKLGLLEVAGS